MIPNSAPMAAVYLTASGRLASLPVAAWDTLGNALVPAPGPGADLVQIHTTDTITLLGIWPYGWTPSHDEMSTLLPKPREEILVTAQQLTDGTWSAFRTVNGVLLASAATLDELHDALDRHHLLCTVEKVVPLGDIDADDEV